MPKVPDGAPRFVESSHGQGAGWLGPLCDPLRIDADPSKPGYSVADFSLHADVPQQRTQRRQELLGQIERQRLELEKQSAVAVAQAHYARAFSLLASPQSAAAFDLTRESAKTRERYGMNIHGQAVLQARRLVEAGVPLVTVFWQNDGITNVSVYWDTHNRNFIDLKERLCPAADQAFTALLEDLEERGLLDQTLVVWTGEMGRTPRSGRAWLAARGPAGTAAITGPPASAASWPAAVSAAAWSTAPATATPPTRPAIRPAPPTWPPPSITALASIRTCKSTIARAGRRLSARARQIEAILQ